MVKEKHGREKNTTTLCSVNEFEQIVGSDEEFTRLRERERERKRGSKDSSPAISRRDFSYLVSCMENSDWMKKIGQFEFLSPRQLGQTDSRRVYEII